MTGRPTLSFPVAGRNRHRTGHAPDPLADPDLYEAVLRRRFWAWVIDQVCIIALIVAAIFLVVVTTAISFGLLTLPGLLIVVLIPFGYHGAFVLAARGTTFGMMCMHLVVRSRGGGEPETLQAFIRFVLFYASVSFLTPLILLLALFSDSRRALHDLLTDTVVVRDLRD